MTKKGIFAAVSIGIISVAAENKFGIYDKAKNVFTEVYKKGKGAYKKGKDYLAKDKGLSEDTNPEVKPAEINEIND